MIKILTVFGTRPEAIKLAPVIKTIEAYPEKLTSVVCATAQHREMLDQVLSVFHISPHYDLNIMKSEQSLADITTDVLSNIRKILSTERPDIVLVQGDTTTTFATSLSAFYHKIKVGHVEAGLRTFDKYQPFPEEMNRRLTGVLADYHFAPTPRARENLLREGVSEGSIIVTGNTGVDALFMALKRLAGNPPENTWLEGFLTYLGSRKLVLVTAHRRENFGNNFEEICRALREIVRRNRDVVILYPVHPNPNIRFFAEKLLNGCERITLVEPLEYGPFVKLLERAYLILTDSGGIQEEAPSLGKPVLVMREVTERAEAIECGTAKLVGTNSAAIIEGVQKLLDIESEYGKASKMNNPFGDGKASERIIQHILKCFASI